MQDVTNEDVKKIVNTDVINSSYYKKLDIFNMTNTKSRVILSQFATRQQKTTYTCGPAAAMMVENYFTGKNSLDEFAVAKIVGTNKICGSDIKGMKKYFEHLGWSVKTSISHSSPKTYADFIKWVKSNLHAKKPIIVENVEWGGHWRVIIGFDDMGTEIFEDDVLILADPYDDADHIRDGYNITSAYKFFYMWFDVKLFENSEKEKPYIIAFPK